MRTSRRAFLGQAGSLPLLLGFPLSGCKPAPAPSWFDDALARMKSEHKPGLVFRLPSSKDHRCLLGHRLIDLHNRGDADVREVFSEAVCMCLEDATVTERIRGARAGDQLIVMDEDGYALDGTLLGPEQLDRFVAEARRILHGEPGNERLKERADSILKSLPAEQRAALERLSSDSDQQALEESAESIMPLLVHRRLTSTVEERKKRLRAVIEKHYRSAVPQAPGPRLPYGVQAQPDMGGCGDDCEESSPRSAGISCGMAMMSPGHRDFVKFITA